MAPPTLRLARAFSQVPITALAFIQSASGARYVLSGEDTHLVIYDEPSSCAVGRVRIFAAQPIHGISVKPQQGGRHAGLLVWGAAELAVLDGRVVEDLLGGRGVEAPVLKTAKAPDWIYDAALSPYDSSSSSSSSAVIVTAHNEIVHVEVDEAAGSLVFGDIISPSRPILYSANLRWTSPNCVLVAGGTVFGEILIWKCYLDRQGGERHETLFVLTGHEGSIFGVHISQELTLEGDRAVRLLASCSDDRTVRIWDITDRTAAEARQHHHHQLSAPRETGFGSTPGQKTTSKETDNGPVAMVMGHASRIWGVRIATPTANVSSKEGLALYSFGEDSTMQKWHLTLDVQTQGDSSLAGKMVHRETFSLHDGKHLWSHALGERDGKTVVTTGGADSKISIIEEPASSSSSSSADVVSEAAQDLTTFSIQDLLPFVSTDTLPSTSCEVFSRYDFISDRHILTTTTVGRLLLGTLTSPPQWRQIDMEEALVGDLKQCYVLKRIGHGEAILGTSTGNLYRFREDIGLKHIATVAAKIVDIFPLPSYGVQHGDGGTLDFLVHLYGTPDAYHFRFDHSTGTAESQSQIKGLDSRFVTVSAAKVKEDLLAVGSRHGWISLLRRKDDGYHRVLDFKSRSRDAITAIVPLQPKSPSPLTTSFFVATSRDGKYRMYEVDDGGVDIRLHLRHETSPPFGPMIEGAWFANSAAPELMLYGFKSKNLMVWNETRREEIISVECGGAHRSFTLMHDPSDSHKLRFAFTKASKLSVFSKHRAAHWGIKPGTHGREVRALSYNGRFLATGAEDASIRIWEHRETPGVKGAQELRFLVSAKAHVAGLQGLKWLGDDCLLSCAGREEFFVWRVRRLDASYAGLAVVCEGVFDDKGTDGNLRIVDFDASRSDLDDSILVTMVLSNSALKTYRYTLEEGFRLLARTFYTGACLTQVRHLEVHENGISVLTASTDGHLVTWTARFEEGDVGSHCMVQAVPIHQSSIKGLDVQASDDGYLVLTGGDDNALGISTVMPSPLDVDTRGCYTVSSRGIVRRAHAAAINGVVLIRRGEETLGVSVSNDQRVKAWRVDKDRIELVADEYSGVADPGDIEVLDKAKCRVVLGGVGVEVWDVAPATS